MTAWRAFVGAATVGQGRGREAGAHDSLDELALVQLRRAKRACPHPDKVWADGARIVEMLDVLSKTHGKGDSEGAENSNYPNHVRLADGGAFILPSQNPPERPLKSARYSPRCHD